MQHTPQEKNFAPPLEEKPRVRYSYPFLGEKECILQTL